MGNVIKKFILNLFHLIKYILNLKLFHSTNQAEESVTDAAVGLGADALESIWIDQVKTLVKRSSVEQASSQCDEEGKEIVFTESNVLKITDFILNEASGFNVPKKLDLFTGLDVTEKDKVFVSWLDCDRPFSTVLLVNGKDNAIGFFEIRSYYENGERKDYLTAKAENINFANHKNTNCYFVFCCPSESDASKVERFKKPIEIEIHDTEEASTHLCIDFGTSTTTAGCFLDDHYVEKISKLAINNGNVVLNSANVATFIDKERVNSEDAFDTLVYRNLVPTLVYVADCSDSNNVEYIFGYDAARRIKDDCYCPKASCFMEIKRWTSNLDFKEDIKDPRGNTASVARGDVIAEFLWYVIRTAENQFKCKFKNVHITSPVKLKYKALESYGKILSTLGYKLEKKNAIDEGFAVLYSVINDQINEGIDEEGKEGDNETKALIIDCGGGTADLASCRYTIDKDDDGIISLNIATEYLNGDVNFGGNNLTYRIMQYMKIVYVHYLTKKERLKIVDLIEKDSNVQFSFIDGESENEDEAKVKARYEEIYQGINEAYAEAEKVIPTRFMEYDHQTEAVYDKVKNNFFFLWKLADEMKKEFYRSTTISRYTFRNNDDNKDIDLHIGRVENWRLSVVTDDSALKKQPIPASAFKEQPYPDITFTAKEIDMLLRADVYYLVRKFLNDLYKERGKGKKKYRLLDTYDRIKLSGQSTKIDIFKDSLREFLPGKKITGVMSGSKEKDAEELKLSCLNGAIMYLHALETTTFEVTLRNETKNIPFSVYVKTQNSEKKELDLIEQGKGWRQLAKKGRLTTSGKVVNLFLRSVDKQIDEPYKFNYENVRYTLVTGGYEDIKKLSFGLIPQVEIDNLLADRKYFFVYLNEKDWGFNIMPIYRDENGHLYRGKVEFCSFEMDILQESFFEGRK